VSGDPWYGDGLRFACRRCGACCTGEPGYVLLAPGEPEALAACLGEEPAAFARARLRRVPGGVSLREQPDGSCVLFASGGCRAYEARPRQCRTYPFWPRVLATPEAWEREGRSCPGIGRGDLHAAAAIAARLKR
jgi:Fe-S-cluster containining protein